MMRSGYVEEVRGNGAAEQERFSDIE